MPVAQAESPEPAQQDEIAPKWCRTIRSAPDPVTGRAAAGIAGDTHRLAAIKTMHWRTELATRAGLPTRPSRDKYDLLVLGGGPAGLTAAVYSASEGLRTLLAMLVDPESPNPGFERLPSNAQPDCCSERTGYSPLRGCQSGLDPLSLVSCPYTGC